jgi:hypothetical protein
LLDFALRDESGRSFDFAIDVDARGSVDGQVLPGRRITGEIAYSVPVSLTGPLFLFWDPTPFTGTSVAVYEFDLPVR